MNLGCISSPARDLLHFWGCSLVAWIFRRILTLQQLSKHPLWNKKMNILSFISFSKR
jgi:hypothetical protein